MDSGPLVSMKMPRRISPSTPTRAPSSAVSARRDGIGTPPSPLCCGAVEVAKPMAPDAIASATRRRIAVTSSGVALRRVASSPMTKVRTDEWPTKAATLGTLPSRSSRARYSGKLSNSQRMPRRSTSRDMPSTWVRLRMVISRSAGRQGAMVKPQLPITTVVTPCAGDGVSAGSQVICAS